MTRTAVKIVRTVAAAAVVLIVVVDSTSINTLLSAHPIAHRFCPPSYALQNAPLDLYDLHFCARRKGLRKRLNDIAGATDERLWLDVDQRYERLEALGTPRERSDVSGVLCVPHLTTPQADHDLSMYSR